MSCDFSSQLLSLKYNFHFRTTISISSANDTLFFLGLEESCIENMLIRTICASLSEPCWLFLYWLVIITNIDVSLLVYYFTHNTAHTYINKDWKTDIIVNYFNKCFRALSCNFSTTQIFSLFLHWAEELAAYRDCAKRQIISQN